MFPLSKIIKEKSGITILIVIFIFSFVLDMYVLTRYNISYGQDGPFYDLQIFSILQTGFAVSNESTTCLLHDNSICSTQQYFFLWYKDWNGT